MTVTIKASSWAKRVIPGGAVTLELPDGMTALAAAMMTGLPEDEIGIITQRDERIPYDASVNDGDELYIWPSIIGG